MKFGEALDYMENGHSVCLPHWKNDVFISIYFPDKNSKMTHRYMYVTSRFGCIPWIPTQIEILSDKWLTKIPTYDI